MQYSIKHFQQKSNLNFHYYSIGSARLTQIMMPLVRRTGGRIIFLSSALAKLPSPVRGMQCAAQAAIEGLAICLRQEVRSRSVNVSIVAAGEFTAGTAWLSEAGMMEQVCGEANYQCIEIIILLLNLIIYFAIGQENVGTNE
jgi:NAD(P)-dependent dehydrogenase (short-subunit alcohol dehydrogenase family)